MKRSKKKGFVKARPPCATATELSSSLFYSLSFSNALPLFLSSSSLCCFLSSHVIFHWSQGMWRSALCCDFWWTLLSSSGIVALWVLCSRESRWGLVFRDCTVLPFIIRHQRNTHKCTHPHTGYGLYFHVFLYPSFRKRIESGLKWKLEGPRESQSETHINIHAHIQESAVSRMDLSWGEYPALMPSLWSEAQALCTSPREGHVWIPPHRLAEGSGPSGAHNTEKRMELPNWAAFSSHTFFTHTRVILFWERLLRAMKLTILDLMSALF